MADKKISALTGATTPLAGSEVLPIVQGGSTVKVSVDNLTVGKTVTTGDVIAVKTSSAAVTDGLTVQNLASAAGTEAGIFFSPTTATGNIRGARITGINDGSNVIGLKFYTGTGAAITSKFEMTADGNLAVSTPNKGIVDSTGTTSLQFTSLQVASNKQIVAPSFTTAAGDTASTPTATPVTLFTPSGDGVWIVNAVVTLTGAPAAYIASSMIKASGGVLAATAISTATNMSISVSGANVQATQTSGGDQIIAFSYIRLF
jgi:hypothetical protein